MRLKISVPCVHLKGPSLLRFESKITARVLGTGKKNMVQTKNKKFTIESTVDLIPIYKLLESQTLFSCALSPSRFSFTSPECLC